MLFSEFENNTLNQAEINEIKSNDNHEIFKVSGQNEWYLAANFLNYIWISQS